MHTLSSTDLPTWLIISSAVLAAIICVLNVTVLIAFIIQHTLRKPQHYYLASLAAADFMVGFISIPFFLQYMYLDRWVLGQWICDAWLTLDFTACMASKMGVFLLTTDRFLLLTFPWKYKNYQTKRNIGILIAVVWINAIILFTTAIAGWSSLVDDGKTREEGSCHVQFMEDRVFTLMWVIEYWMPLVYMCVLYRRICVIALAVYKSSGFKWFWYSNHPTGSIQSDTRKLQTVIRLKSNSVTPQTLGLSTSGSSKKDNSKTDLGDQGVCDGSAQDPCSVTITPDKDVDHIANLRNLEINFESTLCKGEKETGDWSPTTKNGVFSPSPTDTNGKMETASKETDTNRKATKSHVDFVMNEKSKTGPDGAVINGKTTKAPNKAVTSGKAALSHVETVTNGKATKALKEFVMNEKSKNAHNDANKTDVTTPSAVREVTTLKDQCGADAADDGVESTSRSRMNCADVKRNTRGLRRFREIVCLTRQNLVRKRVYESHVRTAIKRVTLILGAFIVCWTPYNVMVFIIAVGGYTNVNTTAYTVTYWICYLNSAVNPLCYALANPELKRTFIRILKLDWHMA
ncbi:muscarinic acetylcholine receptor M2-like [Gigantopelta aegis]|uniref:muscarinic acetylcholine receptor M2-like n=1 Tax=Gigantopelta aegis TaxID=1735272 RepID=UPI001B888F42|nr:muscarinic acetylcholine receptor M2-like [Gigantopelta aegis]